MRKLLFLFVIFLILSLKVEAQNPKTTNLTAANSNTAVLVNMGCEGTSCAGLTIDNTAGGVPLTAAKYNPSVSSQPLAYSQAQRADCYNSGAKIWVTDNMTATLASGKGRAVLDGGVFSIYGFTAISNFKAIRDAAVSSTLFCDYYRQP